MKTTDKGYCIIEKNYPHFIKRWDMVNLSLYPLLIDAKTILGDIY